MARKKRVRLDPYHWHEALDRAHCVGEMAATLLHTHPVIQQNDELHALCDEAMDKLALLYLRIGIITAEGK